MHMKSMMHAINLTHLLLCLQYIAINMTNGFVVNASYFREYYVNCKDLLLVYRHHHLTEHVFIYKINFVLA